jgi:hypothetical protein
MTKSEDNLNLGQLFDLIQKVLMEELSKISRVNILIAGKTHQSGRPVARCD